MKYSNDDILQISFRICKKKVRAQEQALGRLLTKHELTELYKEALACAYATRSRMTPLLNHFVILLLVILAIPGIAYILHLINKYNIFNLAGVFFEGK